MPETTEVTTNGHQTPAEASPMQTGIFNARGVVQTLERLMNEVTKEDCTPATVNAAANCAARITDLLRVHLEAERLQIARRRQG
jgi:hypothetical protein